MRRLVIIAALLGIVPVGAASADDAHSEMTAALLLHADTHPTPAALPVATAASHVAQTPAAKHLPPQAAVAAGHAAAQAQNAPGQAVALAHQAQAAAQAAAGQQQAQEAHQRAKNHPHH